MNTKLYVDNLPVRTSERELENLFAPHGNVAQVSIAIDRASGRSRGFAFVTMVTPEGARSAIRALNGKTFGSRTLAVSEAWPHEQHALQSHPR